MRHFWSVLLGLTLAAATALAEEAPVLRGTIPIPDKGSAPIYGPNGYRTGTAVRQSNGSIAIYGSNGYQIGTIVPNTTGQGKSVSPGSGRK